MKTLLEFFTIHYITRIDDKKEDFAISRKEQRQKRSEDWPKSNVDNSGTAFENEGKKVNSSQKNRKGYKEVGCVWHQCHIENLRKLWKYGKFFIPNENKWRHMLTI